jgi:hypothetical protein
MHSELSFTEKQELCSLVQQLAVYPEEIEELIILIHTSMIRERVRMSK